MAEEQMRVARVMSPSNYVAMRTLAYEMARLWTDVTLKDEEEADKAYDKFNDIAHKFAEGYAEISEYASLSGRLERASALSVLERLDEGVSFEDSVNLDKMLRRGILEGMPFRERMAFVESDIKNGTAANPVEMRRWVSEECERRLAERGVDIKWAGGWRDRVDGILAYRKEYGLNGNERGLDANTARLLGQGKPPAMIQAEAVGVAKVAQENFDLFSTNAQALMERHPDVFDDLFKQAFNKRIEGVCRTQDLMFVPSNDVEEASKAHTLADLDISLRPEKYGKEHTQMKGVQLSFDFDALDIESEPAMEDKEGMWLDV